jgi:NAD(P)-dependent dehydrogenase (short-subunit alcohol dehydrogenase family)
MAVLQGKVAVVTGSSRGLGLEIGRAFAGEGAVVVISARSEQTIQAAVKTLQDAGAQASGFVCDIANQEQVQALADHTIRTHGGLDIWVNNAAFSPPYGPTIHIEAGQFTRVLETNIFGTYYGSLIAMRYFLTQGKGKLINILGRGYRGPQPMQNAYASSKAWMINFTRALAEEYKESGVGVYALNPGMMDTDMLQKVDAIEGYTERVRLLEKIMPILSQPPALPAQAAVRLASSKTDGRTGLVVSEFRTSKIIRNVLGILVTKALRKPERKVHVEITTVPAAFPIKKDQV